MSTADGNCIKGRVMGAIDDALNIGNRGDMENILALIEAQSDLLILKRDLWEDSDQAMIDHISIEVLGDAGSGNGNLEPWWPDIPHKAEILRQAYIKAIRLSLEASGGRPKPIRSMWIHGIETPAKVDPLTPKMPRNFEVCIEVSDWQVTVLWLTPPPLTRTKLPNTEEGPDPLHLCCPDNRVEAMRAVWATKNYTPENKEAHGVVSIQQLIKY